MALHPDADMDAQLARTLIGASMGACDLGEAMATAARVEPGRYDQWHDEWTATAARAEQAGDRAAERGLAALAGPAYLRASEYRRQAYYFLRRDATAPAVRSAYVDHRDLFRRALPFLGTHAEPIVIPFDPVPLDGYLFRPDGDDPGPRPTVLFPDGFDSTCEEMYKYGAHAALAMGWNALTWDGPGQGGQLIEHGMTMRPDFEAVTNAVMDWVLGQPGVAPAAVAMVGRSLGGYLAPRGASGEPRLRALVCDPGQFDFTSRFVSMFSDDDWQRVLDADPTMDDQLEGFLGDPRSAEYYGSRMTAMGAESFGDWLRRLTRYSLAERAELITCPTLVTEGEGDFASQSRKLFDSLTCPKWYHGFTAAEGAGGHCEGMGQQLWRDEVCSWLSGQLGP
jgi:pimeloyl-ACP methyl ester carboxylesterase